MSNILACIKSLGLVTEVIPSSRLKWAGATEDQLDFMRNVYGQNLKYSTKKGKFVADIPKEELEFVEGKHQLKIEAAAACKDLLMAARKAIQISGVKVKTGLNS